MSHLVLYNLHFILTPLCVFLYLLSFFIPLLLGPPVVLSTAVSPLSAVIHVISNLEQDLFCQFRGDFQMPVNQRLILLQSY